MRRSLSLAVLITLITCVSMAKADEEWSIDTANPAGTPTRLIEYQISEGTWMSLDVSPDGGTIVFDLMGHIYQMPIDGGVATALTEGRSWNMLPRFNPTGSEIAFTSDRDGADNIWLLSRTDGALKNLTKSPDPVVRGNWSTDGRHIVASRLPRELTLHTEIYNQFGKKQELLKSDVFRYANQWVEDANRQVFYYEHNNARLPRDGARIYRYDKRTGESDILIQRPGGAFNPHLSPNGQHLAYLGRNDLHTALYVRNLDTHEDRLVLDQLDRDQMESLSHYGTGTGMDWLSDEELVMSHRGGIYRVRISDGATAQIPFTATVSREINDSIRFTNTVASGEHRTRIQRFAQLTDKGVISEALGDLYLTTDGSTRNLTRTDVLESNPVYDPNSGSIYYVTWSDADGGAIVKRRLRGGSVQTLTDVPTQYGALSLSADGKQLAFLRGRQHTSQGGRLENQTVFELMLRDSSGHTSKITEVNAAWGRGNTPEIRRASAIHFAADGETLLFAEFGEEGLLLKSIGTDGKAERTLYHFPDASRAAVSPDGQWIAFREYQRFYLTPFEYIGKQIKVSADQKLGYTKRITEAEGVYLNWSADSQEVYWTRGTVLHRKTLASILAADNVDTEESTQDLAVTYTVATPSSDIALTNARVITMDAQRTVHNGTTVLIADNKIRAIGSDISIPTNAEVFDLSGKTVIPGIVDAHGHYFGGNQSYLHVIEEHAPGLLAPLAYGVTTLFEVYGSAEKDAWLRDRLDAGLSIGPRLYTVGTPIFGAKYRPGLYRPVRSLEDARQVLSYNKAFDATAVKDYTMFTRKARHATATAARELGLNDIAETAGNLAMNLTQVIDGISGLEHSMGMTPLYDDVLKFLAAAKVGITPTLLVVYNGPAGEQYFHHNERVWENTKLLNFLNKQELLRVRRPTFHWDDEHYAPKMAAELKRFYEAGVPLHMGAHGQMSGLDAHWEMELFQQGGYTPMQILEISTINGAAYHGLSELLGSIEPGKLADLVILKDDPLSDIRNTRAIEMVMLNGVLYNGDDAARIYPDPAPPVSTYINPQADRLDHLLPNLLMNNTAVATRNGTLRSQRSPGPSGKL